MIDKNKMFLGVYGSNNNYKYGYYILSVSESSISLSNSTMINFGDDLEMRYLGFASFK